MASFEEQLAALESVVERLERGELTLDDSVRLFEQGVTLSSACKKQLDAAEGRIQVLVAPETGGGVRDLEVAEEDEDEIGLGDEEE